MGEDKLGVLFRNLYFYYFTWVKSVGEVFFVIDVAELVAHDSCISDDGVNVCM